MLVTALSITNCPKCDQSKKILEGYPVKWVDVYADDYWREEVKKFTDTVPFFIIGVNGGAITYSRSAMKVKKMFDEEKKQRTTTPHSQVYCSSCGNEYVIPMHEIGYERCKYCDTILTEVDYR